jgi:gliding motility-associated transport system ATP-binding protein
VTSHILTEIERVATHVAILLHGQLLTVQSLEQGAATSLRLKVRSASADPVRARLSAVPGVTRVVSAAASVDGVHDFVVAVAGLSTAEHVAASLAAGGFGLLEMTETRTDLERLFLDLTGRAAA